ncbi:hypothetical protein [Staphylococcus phage LY01]|nr:hypothetical protein [Staphylococcus phage LY01]
MEIFWKVSKVLLKLSRSVLTFIEFNFNKKKYPPYLSFLLFHEIINWNQIPDEFKDEVLRIMEESLK